MEAQKYIIQDLYHSKDTFQYIENDTESLERIWVSIHPLKVPKTKESFRPKVFDTKTEAKRYLKEIKRQARVDWQDNSHIHKSYGYRKPEWDIYDYKEPEQDNGDQK